MFRIFVNSSVNLFLKALITLVIVVGFLPFGYNWQHDFYLQMKIIIEELASAASNLWWKGCREHEGLPRLLRRHAGNADGTPDVWHEALVQHAVCLIQDEELEAAEGDMASFSKI